MNPHTIDIVRSADLIIRRLLAVKPAEQVALICDPATPMEMAYALAGKIQSVGAEYTILMMPTRPLEHKNDLSPIIEKALECADCLIVLTGACSAPIHSLTVNRLCDDKKLRLISMAMRGLDNFIQGGAYVDYASLHIEGQKLATIWQKARHIHLTSEAGSDLQASILDETVLVQCGFATKPGMKAAFSDGEVSQIPEVNSAKGVLVIDGPITHIGVPSSPITLLVSKGRITQVQGKCHQAEQLQHIIETIENADNIAEIGIGLNWACRQNDDVAEAIKRQGNVHVAIGDNIFHGGSIQSKIHINMVMYHSNVRLDNRIVLEKGQMQVASNEWRVKGD